MAGLRLPAGLLLLSLIPLLAFAGSIKHVRDAHWTTAYDRHFKKYAKHYFGPLVDWHWFKAQGIAESGLDPKARSAVGAKGIMQIMPATAAELGDGGRQSFFVDPACGVGALQPDGGQRGLDPGQLDAVLGHPGVAEGAAARGMAEVLEAHHRRVDQEVDRADVELRRLL